MGSLSEIHRDKSAGRILDWRDGWHGLWLSIWNDDGLKMNKLILYGILLLAVTGTLGGFIWHYRHISAEAAKVPLLEEQIKSANARATDAAEQLAINNTRHDRVDTLLSEWQGTKNEILRNLRNLPRPAVATLAQCAPSVADRRVRNDAISAVLGTGPAGSPTPLSPGSSPVDGTP